MFYVAKMKFCTMLMKYKDLAKIVKEKGLVTCEYTSS